MLAVGRVALSFALSRRPPQTEKPMRPSVPAAPEPPESFLEFGRTCDTYAVDSSADGL